MFFFKMLLLFFLSMYGGAFGDSFFLRIFFCSFFNLFFVFSFCSNCSIERSWRSVIYLVCFCYEQKFHLNTWNLICFHFCCWFYLLFFFFVFFLKMHIRRRDVIYWLTFCICVCVCLCFVSFLFSSSVYRF